MLLESIFRIPRSGETQGWGEPWPALSKGRNAVPAHRGDSLRAGREGVVHGVMPLAKGRAIAGASCLVANPFRSAECDRSYDEAH